MNFWLMKTEPNTYSWDDLKNEPEQITSWDGIRNYQARNLMRDDMKVGDQVFFYDSIVKPLCIMGIVEVVREVYPDHTALDPESNYFDPKSTPDKNRWQMVDVRHKQDFDPPITRDELKDTPGLEDMMLLRKGSRLSIQPVTAEEWEIVTSLR